MKTAVNLGAGCALLILFVFLFAIFPELVIPISVTWHLVTGWALHGYHLISTSAVPWGTVGLMGAGITLWFFGAHYFLSWLYPHLNVAGTPWTPRRTVSFGGILLLGFTAGISMIGVTHQASWLRNTEWISHGRYWRNSPYLYMQEIAQLGEKEPDITRLRQRLPMLMKNYATFESKYEFILREDSAGKFADCIFIPREPGNQMFYRSRSGGDFSHHNLEELAQTLMTPPPPLEKREP